MKVGKVLLPAAAENCYIAINEDTNESIIIDPGSAFERIKSAVESTGTKPVAILLTHGHFDHAGEAASTAKEYGIKVYTHEATAEELKNPSINLSGDMFGDSKSYSADVFLKDDEEIDLAGLHIKCLFTPGHTPGGCCFYFTNEDIVFTGDTLFSGSVGRTDFPGGSMSQLVGSIKSKLMTLSDDTICYPGHNEPTTIGTERIYNPFL
ncbi:MBL fold metallo-hydrolase [Pseudobutyrivibrio ruminis]|uniref:Glyoxylase, beta-lactamase superfamily II n=1 Tax=Pseudobutyrivibrio ruminis DSM 9787 TaxID=1123011 RepID=A0A285S3R0_9FIRM|nr:MBL fold metallo-hydrolase [Pseudobutyrivibrio ruminis]SOC01418.1 Glyoxylase, beta-lactamase superfamily II [Pseudobutyrivibrio ruminis DSM 9787]